MDQVNENKIKLRNKKCRSTYSKIALGLTVAYVAAYIAAIGLGILINYLEKNKILILSDIVSQTITSFVPMYIICFPIIIIVLKRIEKTVQEKNKMDGKRLFILFSICFPIMLVGNLIGTFLSYIFSKGQAENTLATLLQQLNPVMIIIAVFVGPFFEELVFRKMIIDRTVKYGEKAAIIFSSLTFAMFHMNLYQIFYAFGIGLILGYIYVRSGEIKYTMVIHMIINGLSSIVVPFLLYKSEYMELVERLSGDNPDIEFLSAHAVWVGLYLVYTMLYFSIICFGLAMLIVNIKKIIIKQREEELPVKKAIGASLLNVGMILFTVLTIIFIILTLLSSITS